MHESWLTGPPRLFGLTMEGDNNADPDGTGLVALDAAAAIIELPQRPMIRIPMFPKIHPSVYVPIIHTLKEAGASILLLVVDSSAMAKLSVAQFQAAHQKARDVLGPYLDEHDIVECGNEISGQRGDKKWPGPFAVQKAQAGLQVWKGSAQRRLITFFLTIADLSWVNAWISAHSLSLQCEVAGWSIYPRTAPHTNLPTWGYLFSLLAQYYSGSDLIVSEYGSQDGQGRIDWTAEAQIVKDFEGRARAHPRDIGGHFNWNAYHGLVDTGLLLPPFQEKWAP